MRRALQVALCLYIKLCIFKWFTYALYSRMKRKCQDHRLGGLGRIAKVISLLIYVNISLQHKESSETAQK